ncbi:hypothetical protein HXZ91_04800 [Myroides odoratimimus]|uniref:hypothetical protein n=1 Tax=Myroides odoratimimus TaxID=76832 RepID=UPI002577FF31|nr:hypothetical protein [Myroides odoratimimus]MDM1033797.1 hypothetical protein [Myroides odoratimimus]
MEVTRLTVDSVQLTDCVHSDKHSEVQGVYCTVVHLDVVCDCCGQVVKKIIEV